MNEHCVQFIKDHLFAIILQIFIFKKFSHFFEFSISQNWKISKKAKKGPGLGCKFIKQNVQPPNENEAKQII